MQKPSPGNPAHADAADAHLNLRPRLVPRGQRLRKLLSYYRPYRLWLAADLACDAAGGRQHLKCQPDRDPRRRTVTRACHRHHTKNEYPGVYTSREFATCASHDILHCLLIVCYFRVRDIREYNCGRVMGASPSWIAGLDVRLGSEGPYEWTMICPLRAKKRHCGQRHARLRLMPS